MIMLIHNTNNHLLNWDDYKIRHDFYQSKEWRMLRAFKLQLNPLCEFCFKHNKFIDKDIEVDHIIDIKERPDLRFTLSNLQSLCKSCHSYKTTDSGTNGKITNTRLEQIINNNK